MASKAPYLLKLCELAQSSDIFLGLATRLGAQCSTFNLDAIRVIQSIVTFSPAQESVAIEFLFEFERVSHIKHEGNVLLMSEWSFLADGVLVAAVLSGSTTLDAAGWANAIIASLATVVNTLTVRQRDIMFKPVLNLASEYF